MSKLEFLPFRKEHILGVLDIENKSFPEPWTQDMFEREISLPISHFFVAKSGCEIVGYAGYWKIIDEAHIVNLAVSPNYRKQGLGRQILEYLIENITNQGLEKILLEVRVSNNAAKNLYSSMGFIIVGSRPKYYKNEDAILMEKQINSLTKTVQG